MTTRVLPQPGGDWQEWAGALLQVLEAENIVTISDVQDTPSRINFPVTDTSGRVMIDVDGVYGYDSGTGAIVFSPNEVNIDTQHLADAAITTAKLGATSVTTDKLVNLAVDATKLADSSVVSTKIANAAVGTAAIANAAVGNAQIANAAITSAKIGNAQILEAKIADLAVTNAKITSIAAGKITAGVISAAIEMTSPVIRSGKSGPGDSGGNGFWIGQHGGTGKLRVGSSSSNEIYFDGSGTLKVRGSLNANDITAGTITGRTLRTASSGSRFVVSASSGEGHYYNGSGQEVLSLGQTTASGTGPGSTADYAIHIQNITGGIFATVSETAATLEGNQPASEFNGAVFIHNSNTGPGAVIGGDNAFGGIGFFSSWPRTGLVAYGDESTSTSDIALGMGAIDFGNGCFLLRSGTDLVWDDNGTTTTIA